MQHAFLIRPPLLRLAVALAVPLFLSVAQKNRETLFAQRVSERGLLKTVRTLSGFGNRLGGSPSGELAAKHVERQFRAAGLAVSVVEDPERLVCVNRSWELGVEEPRKLRRVIRNEWLGGFSPASPRQRAPLRFLGSSEVDSTNLNGCVVLTNQYVTEAMYLELVQAGAVCVLSYAPGDSTMYGDAALITDLPASSDNPIPLFNISFSNGSQLRREIQGGTSIIIRFASSTAISRGHPKTVLAELKGKSEKYFLVCAHGDSDSGGPGADDNASGVAGVLELARVLMALVKEKKLDAPEYTILFAVWGSEYFSSDAFVARKKDELSEIMGVLNYDQIGTGETRNCIYFESNDVAHNEHFMRVLETVGDDYAGKKGFWDESTTNPSQGGTDSYVFLPDYLRRIGVSGVEIPSVTVYTAAWNESKSMPQTTGWRSKGWKGNPDSVIVDYSRYYHSSRDVPETTTEREPFNMSSAVKAVGIALLRLAW
jgi:hypothetical protein